MLRYFNPKAYDFPSSSTVYVNMKNWLDVRPKSPTRVVFGRGGSHVAWQPMGAYICGPQAPQSVEELLASAQFLYTSIRIVALGVHDTYIIIWDDGTMRWSLKSHYPALDNVLSRCTGMEVSVRKSASATL